MSYEDEHEHEHESDETFSRPEVLITIRCAATGKLLQEISLPAIEEVPFAELSPDTDTQAC